VITLEVLHASWNQRMGFWLCLESLVAAPLDLNLYRLRLRTDDPWASATEISAAQPYFWLQSQSYGRGEKVLVSVQNGVFFDRSPNTSSE
jgi:hypothetical protein